MGVKIAAVVAAGIVISSGFWAIALVAGRQQGSDTGLRAVICYFEQRTAKSKQLTPKAKLQGIRVLDHSLAVAHLSPCGTTN